MWTKPTNSYLTSMVNYGQTEKKKKGFGQKRHFALWKDVST